MQEVTSEGQLQLSHLTSLSPKYITACPVRVRTGVLTSKAIVCQGWTQKSLLPLSQVTSKQSLVGGGVTLGEVLSGGRT